MRLFVYIPINHMVILSFKVLILTYNVTIAPY